MVSHLAVSDFTCGGELYKPRYGYAGAIDNINYIVTKMKMDPAKSCYDHNITEQLKGAKETLSNDDFYSLIDILQIKIKEYKNMKSSHSFKNFIKGEYNMYYPLNLVKQYTPEAVFSFEEKVPILFDNFSAIRESLGRYLFYTLYKQNGLEVPQKEGIDENFEKTFQDTLSKRKRYVPGCTHHRFSDEIDLVAITTGLMQWAKFKQVYKPDPIFAAELIKTSGVSIFEDTLRSLSTTTFWIDTLDLSRFGDIKGILVDINEIASHEEGHSLFNISTIQFSEERGAFHQNVCLSFLTDHKDDPLRIEPKDLSDSAENFYEKACENMPAYSYEEIILFSYEMIEYLSMKPEKLDIKESETTIKTYHPLAANAIPKNKFSEITIKDVGYLFGSSFKKKIESTIKEKRKEHENLASITKQAPAPHYVSAHWMHVWTGEGRITLETRWIEPYFTGIEKEPNFATIHTVS